MQYDDINRAGMLERFQRAYNKGGMIYVLRSGLIKLFGPVSNYVACYYFKIFKSSRTFIFKGKRYKYFYHRYNNTWKNERVVEIPIIWEMVNEYEGKRILEVGNVLSYYFHCNHDVVDKYEKGTCIINEDVVDFQAVGKYDLIVNISTLEHIGWDEKPRNPMKILYAVENLIKCLHHGGKIVITLPLGYNTKMDELLKEGKIRFPRQYYLKRISKDNRWIETDWNGVVESGYGNPFPNANGLVIGIIERTT